MKQFEIKITGSGAAHEIVGALMTLIASINEKDPENSTNGEWEFEDNILFTNLSEIE